MKTRPHDAAKTKPSAKKATAKKAAKKVLAPKTPPPSRAEANQARLFAMSFASVYLLYVKKAEKKGRTKHEVDAIIEWLTGYSAAQLERVIDAKVAFEDFFAQAPRMHPNARLITGLVCGVRVELVADPLMKQIRYLDKLIDELANGKKMESILRQ